MIPYRRRPVPAAFREEHELDVSTYRSYFVRGGGYSSKAGGRCACGEVFGNRAGRSNMNSADVRDDWKDHVEEAYYGAR